MALFIVTATLVKLRDLLFFVFSFRTGDINPPFTAVGGGGGWAMRQCIFTLVLDVAAASNSLCAAERSA